MTIPRHKEKIIIIGSVSAVVILTLLVVIIVLVLVIVYCMKKNKKYKHPSATNCTLLADIGHSNAEVYNYGKFVFFLMLHKIFTHNDHVLLTGNIQVTTNHSELSHNDDTHQCSAENDVEQPRDYCEISDDTEDNTALKTAPNMVDNLTIEPDSNYSSVTKEPEEGEYENSSAAVSLEFGHIDPTVTQIEKLSHKLLYNYFRCLNF